MIGEPVGAIAIFAQVQHARYPRWRRWRARTGAKSGSRLAAKTASVWPNAHIARPATHCCKPRPSAAATVPLTIAIARGAPPSRIGSASARCIGASTPARRTEEHKYELQYLIRISDDGFRVKKK